MRFLFIFFILIFSSCFEGSEMKDHVDGAYTEAGLFAQKIEHRYPGAGAYGIGGSYFDEQIHYISLAIAIPVEVDLMEARVLSVSLGLEFVNQLNQNIALRLFTKENIFNESHSNLRLEFASSGSNSEKNITDVFSIRDSLVYYHDSKKSGKLEKIHEETWQEAIEIVDNTPGEDHFEQNIE